MRRRADITAIRGTQARVPSRWLSLLAALAIGIPLSATLAATAGAKSVVPSCTWAPARVVSKTLGEPVRALPGVWTTVTAPLLTCAYDERQPLLQSRNVPILQIRFAETQRLAKNPKSKKVRKLGHCQTACPANGAAAWLSVTYTRKPAIYSFRYVSAVDLRVQDGLNAIELILATPDGPLPVGNAVTQLEDLMRRLLPKFTTH